jgi:hypothetical protein
VAKAVVFQLCMLKSKAMVHLAMSFVCTIFRGAASPSTLMLGPSARYPHMCAMLLMHSHVDEDTCKLTDLKSRCAQEFCRHHRRWHTTHCDRGPVTEEGRKVSKQWMALGKSARMQV